MKSSKATISRITVEVIVFLFIVLFLYASVTKLLTYEGFVYQLSRSPLIGRAAIVVGWLVPLVELVIVGMLMIPKYGRLGLYCSFSLMVLFTLYIIVIFAFSTEIPCSCGGVLNSLGWGEHLLFNAVFVAFGGIGIVLDRQRDVEENLAV